MSKVTGFLEVDPLEPQYQPAADRVRHFNTFTYPPSEDAIRNQARRCMECGVPYCHTGCPVNNQIPDWNDLVYNDNWQQALQDLHSTNNFPEFTGQTCPAPCEAACTLALVEAPVTIKQIENAIVEKGWAEGWITPQAAPAPTGKRVAIVGTGPAGLAAAQQLVRVGHHVEAFDREPRAGGLLRYGIPDFKLEKSVVDRRLDQLLEEGVVFRLGQKVGDDISGEALCDQFDAVLIACGAERPRDPKISGAGISGVHYAMPFLVQQNRRNGREQAIPEEPISAAGKHVVVVGGGDTASDCIGTAFRQGAISVVQIDIRPRPPHRENTLEVWPEWPVRFRVSTSQAEGALREFSTGTLQFESTHGILSGLRCVRVDANREPVPGSAFVVPAQLALLAIGFAGVEAQPMIDQFGLALSANHRIIADEPHYRTSCRKVYAAGDARRGQSLVVWAIREGRQAARAIDIALRGTSALPLL